MSDAPHVPHIDLLLQALRINRDRLDGRSKIAVDAKLLKALLQAAAGSAPFDAAFYLNSYPDIAEAHAAGEIPDLRRHFVETGFFEGRLGGLPEFDERFYIGAYPDVAEAVRNGEMKSGTEHYLRSGASEGRVPTEAARPAVEAWMMVLRD